MAERIPGRRIPGDVGERRPNSDTTDYMIERASKRTDRGTARTNVQIPDDSYEKAGQYPDERPADDPRGGDGARDALDDDLRSVRALDGADAQGHGADLSGDLDLPEAGRVVRSLNERLTSALLVQLNTPGATAIASPI